MNSNTVLLIEDDEINIKVAISFLKEIGINNVDIASNGINALDLIKSNEYSLILLDIGLPDMSGFEICNLVKNTTNLNSIPIIAITAYVLLKEECLKSGFDDFIAKPMDINILKGFIEKWLPKE